MMRRMIYEAGRFLKRIKNTGISRKIAFIYLIMFVPLFTITAFITYNLGISNLLDTTIANNLLVLKNTTDQLDNVVKDMERISKMTISDRNLQTILGKGNMNYDYEYLQDQKWFDQFFFNLSTIRNDVSAIRIVVSSKVAYKYNNKSARFIPDFDYSGESWIALSRESKGRAVFIGTHYIKDVEVPERAMETSKMVFSVARQINSITIPNKPLGFVMIDSDLATMEAIINKFKGKDSDIIICDEERNILYHKDYRLITQKLDSLVDTTRLKNAGTGNFMMKADDGNMLLTFLTSDYTKWTVISLTPERIFRSRAEAVKNLDFLIIFIGVLMSIVISFALSKAITKNIILLNNSMKRVETGDLEVKLETTAGDEIGELTNTFNNMVKRLRRLIQKEYLERIKRQEAEIKKKNAELIVLQNQINPHFLYNTLDTIRITAALNNDKSVDEMLFTLSTFFRLSIFRGEEFTTLEKELELIQCYMQIHKYRYGDRIECIYDIPDEILDYKIPRFIIQPLVENSIHHGLELKKGKGSLIINAALGENLEISISDNGKGMSADDMERYDKLFKSNIDLMNPIDGKISRIGLVNVHQRIVLTYGKHFGLTLSNNVDGGLTVKIKLPGVNDEA